MGTQTPDNDFNTIQFEKRLTALKDSQDNINACCKWCLENRQQHKKIVASWLNVLKRVKVEQRVTLFYLANDVIQYSKRRNFEFVDSWGTALQKATTLVRDDKVKHKIVRIFNIWQQRGVYNEEFISDLCGLISVVPTAPKNDEPHEFQASYVINKIKHCSKLEDETDLKLKTLKEHNPKIQLETESLCVSLKDRAHVDDVEKELDTYVKHLEGYINALKAEIKCRITNISVLKQANGHLDKDKRDVKVVANAYKTFGSRIKAFQKKLEEHKSTLLSPIPSPDINAPSPGPDCDIELPDDNDIKPSKTVPSFNPADPFTAGYYNPVPPPSTDGGSSFVTNGYTSFIGGGFNPSFSMQSLNTSSLFTNTQTTALSTGVTQVTNSNNYNLNTDLNNVLQSISQPPPPPSDVPSNPQSFQYQPVSHLPLLPPPMPPFAPKTDYETSYTSTFNNSDKSGFVNTPFTTTETSYNSSGYETTTQASSFDSSMSDYPSTSFDASAGPNPYPPVSDEYNPEQELDTWEPDGSWAQPPLDTDTPESPPMFEKEGYNEPVEYHDNMNNSGAADVDHRVLHPLNTNIENVRGRGKDVDHRNLISLTGSPADTNSHIPASNVWNQGSDQDYRPKPHTASADQDYRLPPFNLEQLKLPPPPPPPATNKKPIHSPRKPQDCNVESIDMDLSEDENEPEADKNIQPIMGNSARGNNSHMSSLKPPPPLPDLPDDVDANSFLDDLSNDLNSQEFTANLPQNNVTRNEQFDNMSQPPPGMQFPPPPLGNNLQMHPPPLLNTPPNNWMVKQPNQNFGFRGRGNNRGNFNGNRGNQRGRGRGFRGGNNFRGRTFGGRGAQGRATRGRGNARGNFHGNF